MRGRSSLGHADREAVEAGSEGRAANSLETLLERQRLVLLMVTSASQCSIGLPLTVCAGAPQGPFQPIRSVIVNDLVKRLSAGSHEVEISLRAERTVTYDTLVASCARN